MEYYYQKNILFNKLTKPFLQKNDNFTLICLKLLQKLNKNGRLLIYSNKLFIFKYTFQEQEIILIYKCHICKFVKQNIFVKYGKNVFTNEHINLLLEKYKIKTNDKSIIICSNIILDKFGNISINIIHKDNEKNTHVQNCHEYFKKIYILANLLGRCEIVNCEKINKRLKF